MINFNEEKVNLRDVINFSVCASIYDKTPEQFFYENKEEIKDLFSQLKIKNTNILMEEILRCCKIHRIEDFKILLTFFSSNMVFLDREIEKVVKDIQKK